MLDNIAETSAIIGSPLRPTGTSDLRPVKLHPCYVWGTVPTPVPYSSLSALRNFKNNVTVQCDNQSA